MHPMARSGLAYWRTALDRDHVREVDGIPVTDPVRTAFDLARTEPLENAVVALDTMGRQLGVSPEAVIDFLRGHRAFRGVPVGLRAAALADPRSRSGGESRLRLVWTQEARLPRPESNPLIVDYDGVVVAMPDLLDPGTGFASEYDGSTHRDLAAHTRDNAREEELEHLGIVVVRATSLDLGPYRQSLVRRLRDGHRRAQAAAPTRSWGWRPSPLPTMIQW